MSDNKKNTLAVIAGSFLGFIGILIGTSLVVTFPTLIKEFNTSLSVIQWASSGYYLCATIIMSATGYIMQRYSLKQIFIFAGNLFLVGCIISANAHHIYVLLIGCLLNAVATGLATPLMYQIVFHQIDAQDFGKYNGIVTMIKSFGPAFGPTYGGILTFWISWRMIFILVIPVVIIVLILGMKTIPNDLSSKNTAKFNFNGIILFAIALTAFSIFISKLAVSQKNIGSNLILLIISIIAIAIFVFNYKHSKRIFLNFSILTKKIEKIRLVCFFCLQFMNLSLAFILPLYVEDVLHYNSMIAGLLLLPGALLGAICSPFAGKTYDRYGSFKTLLGSAGLLMVGVVLFAINFDQLTIGKIITFYIIFRLGYTFGFGNIMSDAGKFVNEENRSEVSSLFNTFQQYAGTLGNNLMTALINIWSRLGVVGGVAVLQGGKFGVGLLILVSIIVIILTISGKNYQIYHE